MLVDYRLPAVEGGSVSVSSPGVQASSLSPLGRCPLSRSQENPSLPCREESDKGITATTVLSSENLSLKQTSAVS